MLLLRAPRLCNSETRPLQHYSSYSATLKTVMLNLPAATDWCRGRFVALLRRKTKRCVPCAVNTQSTLSQHSVNTTVNTTVNTPEILAGPANPQFRQLKSIFIFLIVSLVTEPFQWPCQGFASVDCSVDCSVD